MMRIQGTCSACLKTVRPVRPSRLWWVVAIVVAPVVLISFMFLAIMQPIGMVAGPLYFAFLTFPIVGLAEKLGAKPKCPKCRKNFVERRVTTRDGHPEHAHVGSSEAHPA